MTATNYFVSVPFREVVGGILNKGGMHSGTSTSANDFIELRMMRYTTGTTETGVTRKDVINALHAFEKWVLDGGLLQNGTNVPLL